MVRFGCVGEAGAPTLAAVSVECELAYQEDVSVDVLDTEVHLVIRVGKDAEVGDFVGNELGVFERVCVGYAEVDEQADVDPAGYFSVYLHGGLGDSLDDYSHVCFLGLTGAMSFRVRVRSRSWSRSRFWLG